jgi:hypothetical protein
MELKDIVTTVSALVGMGLGIYNFLYARSADRVKLKIIPKASSLQGKGPNGSRVYRHNRDKYESSHPTAPSETLSTEIINLSKFAVTVDEVGLKARWSRERMVLVVPIVPDGKPWPRKLEPRESVTVLFDPAHLLALDRIGSVTRVYASTVCGTTHYGSSGALRDFVRLARAA